MKPFPGVIYRFPNKRVSVMKDTDSSIFHIKVEQCLSKEAVAELLKGYKSTKDDFLVRERIRVRWYFFHNDTMQAIAGGFGNIKRYEQERIALKHHRENIKAQRITERLDLMQDSDANSTPEAE